MLGFIIIFLMILCLYISTIEKVEIRGCEAREENWQDVYLTRWILYKGKKTRLYFHKFTRSDYDDLHDHPWNFFTFILWGGYYEERLNKLKGFTLGGFPVYEDKFGFIEPRERSKTWYKPLTFLYRPAETYHRVVLKPDKKAYSLVLTFYKHRQWGFLTKTGWMHWRTYFKSMDCI